MFLFMEDFGLQIGDVAYSLGGGKGADSPHFLVGSYKVNGMCISIK